MRIKGGEALKFTDASCGGEPVIMEAMNPDSLHQPPSFDLPPPQPAMNPEEERQPGLVSPEQAGEKQPRVESQSQAPQVPAASYPPPLNGMSGLPGMPSPVPIADPQVQSAAVSVNDDDGLAADDADLIEKAWVERAKAIVAGTRDDPYRQNRELNSFKADYMKKRYNKEIKVE